MNALEYLQKKDLLHIGMIQVLRRGTAEVYQEGEDGVFLRDTVSGAWMLSSKDTQTGIGWLQERERCGYHLMQLCQREIADFAQREYGLETRLECYQAVYRGRGLPQRPGKLTIRVAGVQELKTIRANYDKLSDEELEEILSLIHISERRGICLPDILRVSLSALSEATWRAAWDFWKSCQSTATWDLAKSWRDL